MDLKKFLESKSPIIKCSCGRILSKNMIMIEIEDLGMFFWNRGGIEFIEDTINSADVYFPTLPCNKFPKAGEFNRVAKEHSDESYAQDYLDALACLGKEKIKKLIEEL